MPALLEGRTALVTGSTSGIGAAIARTLAAAGATVVVSGRDRTRGSEVVGSIRAAGGRADFLHVDLAAEHAGNEASRAVLDALTATTPAGVVVRPEDIAQGVLFLTSDAARMMHGSILAIDGGISSTRLS